MTPAAALAAGDQDWWEPCDCCCYSFAGYERLARLPSRCAFCADDEYVTRWE